MEMNKHLTHKQMIFEFMNQHVELQNEKTVSIINKFREEHPDSTAATSTLYQFIKNFKRIGKDGGDDKIIVI